MSILIFIVSLSQPFFSCFLDSSQLDSENAFLTMKLLKDLSIKMRVATLIIIHQPSPDTFALFDSLILLSKGRCLFSDSCSNLSTFYESNYDENIPINTALADDLIIKASNYVPTNDDAAISLMDPISGEDFLKMMDGYHLLPLSFLMTTTI